MTTLPGPSVADNDSRQRYEATLADGEVAGYAAYERADGVTTFTHPVVEPQHEGKGIGSALVRAALEAERAAGRRIVPQCSFVRAFVERHPEHADLVVGS